MPLVSVVGVSLVSVLGSENAVAMRSTAASLWSGARCAYRITIASVLSRNNSATVRKIGSTHHKPTRECVSQTVPGKSLDFSRFDCCLESMSWILQSTAHEFDTSMLSTQIKKRAECRRTQRDVTRFAALVQRDGKHSPVKVHVLPFGSVLLTAP